MQRGYLSSQQYTYFNHCIMADDFSYSYFLYFSSFYTRHFSVHMLCKFTLDFLAPFFLLLAMNTFSAWTSAGLDFHLANNFYLAYKPTLSP